MVSIQELEPVLANQRRTVAAFLQTTFNAKSFIKSIQEELNHVAEVLADDTQTSITLDGTTFEDKTSQGALLAITNFTTTKTSVAEGYTGLVGSLDSTINQIRQLARG